MSTPKVTPLGKRNATFQVFQSLRTNRNSRHREKRFIVEGVKPLAQLLANKWEFEALLIQEGKQSPWARQYAEKVSPSVIYEVSPELMAEMSNKDENPELMAVVKMPALDAASLPSEPGVYVIADRPNSPGNLGSLIRTAEAFGAKAVLSYGHSADFFDQKTISASIGAVFAIPLAQLESPEAFKRWSAGLAGAQLVALDENGDVESGKLDLGGTKIVVVGNETDGLSKVFKESCDIKVRIPMVGTATSLNAACSGSILLYELLARKPKE